jgi:hypothetical protein
MSGPRAERVIFKFVSRHVMTLSHWISLHVPRVGLVLAAVSLALLACAFLLTIGLLLAGYSLVDIAEWFVRVTSH